MPSKHITWHFWQQTWICKYKKYYDKQKLQLYGTEPSVIVVWLLKKFPAICEKPEITVITKACHWLYPEIPESRPHPISMQFSIIILFLHTCPMRSFPFRFSDYSIRPYFPWSASFVTLTFLHMLHEEVCALVHNTKAPWRISLCLM
jgi:hypothetical protein